MDKGRFNKLDITDQVEYINNKLNNSSLTKVCNDISVDRSTISKRFKRSGYTFKDNQFILVTQQECNNGTSDINVNEDRYKVLEKSILALEERLNDLYCNNSTTNMKQDNTIRFYKGDVVVRSHRIDSDIYKRFKQYIDSNKQYKISDIISTALEDFLDKYSK